MEFLIKAAVSGVIVGLVSEIARRAPGFGAAIASLPLIAILAMLWLWRDTGDPARLAAYSTATFWYVLPSLPMFLLIPALLKRGATFPWALGAGCAMTVALFLATAFALRRWGGLNL
jgi:hypothetical protein